MDLAFITKGIITEKGCCDITINVESQEPLEIEISFRGIREAKEVLKLSYDRVQTLHRYLEIALGEMRKDQ